MDQPKNKMVVFTPRQNIILILSLFVFTAMVWIDAFQHGNWVTILACFVLSLPVAHTIRCSIKAVARKDC